MTQPLDHSWRKARKRDRSLIQSTFECAAVRPDKKWAPDYEAEVQRYIRHYALTAANSNRNAGQDRRFLIGVDALGVAAAFTHYRMGPKDYEGELDNPDGLPVRELSFLGIHLRHRRNGGAVADDAIDRAVWDMLDREPEAKRFYVIGRADYRNNGSMRMLERNRFTLLRPGGPPPHEDTRLSWWVRPVDRPTLG